MIVLDPVVYFIYDEISLQIWIAERLAFDILAGCNGRSYSCNNCYDNCNNND